MGMITFNATIEKFDKKGEKTGWTYVYISARQTEKINPGVKVSYRVRGFLDKVPVKQMALMPMGEGDFILTLKADLRRKLGKKAGDKIVVKLEHDDKEFVLSPDLMACLADEPESLKFFKSLSGSHQKYFSNWIESAKTIQTKTKRITMALIAFSKKQGYTEMMRENKGNR